MTFKSMTVREFRSEVSEQVAAYPDDALVYFGTGELSLLRVKDRGRDKTGKTVIQIEFNELYSVTFDPDSAPSS